MVKEIGNVKLHYRNEFGNDLPTDDVIEDALLDIVQNQSEDAYAATIREHSDWATLYHLSPCRKNILEWIPFQKSDRVLEVGSECGALTGCLADKAGSITCIEFSAKKSLVNAHRNRSRQNIEILIGKFEDIEQNLTESYNYITLIGVLEYASQYVSAEQPCERLLSICKKHLKPGGKLLIAVDNQLGMKYWAGCREPHSGLLFEGIEGYSNTNGVQTFSRVKLEELLNNSGFSDFAFYYPYPDYKFPLSIYSDDFLPNPADLYRNVLNYDRDRLLLFDEAKAFDSVIKAGAFSIFANSYLIIAESEDAK